MIKPKAHKCKGTSKVSADGCGKLAIRMRYGLCRKCYIDWLVNTKDGKLFLEKSKIKGKSKADKEKKSLTKKQKEELIDYKSKLQTKVNEIVRLIDIGLPCPAKKRHAKQMHGGHVYSRGAEPSMRYNLHNIHRQSAQSNHFQNEDGIFREGLENEYGSNYMEFISGLRATPALNMFNKEYRGIYLIASKISLELRKEGKTFSKDERIEMRNHLNIKLGIYHLKHCKFNNK